MATKPREQPEWSPCTREARALPGLGLPVEGVEPDALLLEELPRLGHDLSLAQRQPHRRRLLS